MTTPPLARFDDVPAGRSLQFDRAHRVITAERPEQVRAALAEVEEAVVGGAWAIGVLATGRGTRDSHIPFGPCMVLGCLLGLCLT